MDIKTYVEELLIKQREDRAVILEIYKTGSQLLRSDPNDLDFQVVCSGYSQRFTYNKVEIDGVHHDLFIIDREALIRELTFGNDKYITADLKLWNYFHAIRESVYGNCNVGYDMLKYKEAYLAYIKEHYTKRISSGRPIASTYGKIYVHYYMVLKIYENNNTAITDEMRAELELLYSNSETSLPVIKWVIEQITLLGGE